MSDDESLSSTPVSILPEPIHTARPYRFTWDPSSRRPGPESVSGTTEGRGGGDYFSAQPRFNLLNTSNLTLELGTLPQEWSSTKHGFHAISTVLNNPHKRQAPPKAHSSLPAIIPADLPRVRRKDFDSFLRAVQPEWDRFQHNIQLGKEGVAQLSAQTSSSHDENDINTPRPNGIIEISQRAVPSLDSVPSIFFEQNFDLGNPLTFSTVTEQHLSSPDADPTAHALPLLEKFSHYADTVEQHLVLEISRRSTSFFAALTNLHDLRAESEHCLTRIAALRELLTNLDEHSAKRGLEVVRQQVRADNMGRVIDGVRMVGGIVEMSKVAQGLVGAGQWGEALGIIGEMERLWEGRVETSITDSSSTKLERLSEIQEEPESYQDREEPSYNKQDPHPPLRHSSVASNLVISSSISLSSLHAYASLPDHLRVLTMEIAAALSSELVMVLRADLVQRIHQRWDETDSNGPVKVSDTNGTRNPLDYGLRDRLRPPLQGLLRTRGLKEGMLSWREVVLVEVRGVVNTRLPAIDADDSDEDRLGRESGAVDKGANGNVDIISRSNENYNLRAGLIKHLRGMRHPEFMLLLQDLYLGLLNCVEGLQQQGRVISEILDAADGPEETLRPTSQKNALAATDTSMSIVINDELTDVVSSAAELANTQAAKVISLRVEEHAALELADFLVLFNESWNFVVKCEVICRRMIVGLRGVVVSQAKAFLQSFHQARISRSAKLVEDEQWNPAEVSPSLQHITDVIVDSAVRDAPELIIKPDVNISDMPPVTTPTATIQAPRPTNGFNVAAVADAKHLRIDERTYFAVSATTEVLVLLLDYLRLVVNLPMLTTDTMSRVIEFLKAFNSRTCQVVLGAGAMRSAGLKNITAKHLALASQSLSIMFELIPYVRETFRRHLSPKQAVMLVEFDKLKRDYQEHQNEIHSKLIAIMGDRLTAHIKALQAVDWNVPKPGGGVNDYIEILVKETVTLHKVLSRYLSTPVVEFVMTQVFAAINHGLSEEYSKIELPHQEAKTRLLADAKYLHQKLAALKNVGMPSSMLVTVVSEKTLPRTSPPTPTPTRANTLHNVSTSANQRLKGLLSGRTPTFDKALPTPIRTSSFSPSPSQVTIPPPNPVSPVSHIVNKLDVNDKNMTQDTREPISTASTPPQAREPSVGFKQVEILPKSGSDLNSESEARQTDASTKTTNSVLGSEQQQSLPLPSSPPPPHNTSPAPDRSTSPKSPAESIRDNGTGDKKDTPGSGAHHLPQPPALALAEER